MRLSLQQIHTLGVSFNVIDDVIEDEVILDPEYHALANVSPTKVDWSKEEVLVLMVRTALVLRRTSDWLNGKWKQHVSSSQSQRSSSHREQGEVSSSPIPTLTAKSTDRLPT